MFLAYASRAGHALIDRELYLPRSWTDDRDRCKAAGIPDDVEFATKTRQAMAMLQRALDAGVPFAWFTADEIYGQAKFLRAWLEERGVSYVMAIRRCDTFTTGDGEQQAEALIAALPARSWQRLSAGAGAHGPREYHWARIPIPGAARPGRRHWLLARRSLADPERDRLLRLLRARPFPAGGPGLGGWQPLAHRGMLPASQKRSRARPLPGPLLASLACPHHPVDAGPGLAGRQQSAGHKRGTTASSQGMIAYTLPEIRRLLTSLIQACAPDPTPRLVLVHLAAATPIPGPDQPLPAARLCPHLTAVAVLIRQQHFEILR